MSKPPHRPPANPCQIRLKPSRTPLVSPEEVARALGAEPVFSLPQDGSPVTQRAAGMAAYLASKAPSSPPLSKQDLEQAWESACRVMEQNGEDPEQMLAQAAERVEAWRSKPLDDEAWPSAEEMKDE